ncbi:Potassium channel and Ion transport domain containing protein [Aphelenchoides besseyi]|nr:Potassium channel and Ion transport domain containing protein [Aphelenchoides besseyi]
MPDETTEDTPRYQQSDVRTTTFNSSLSTTEPSVVSTFSAHLPNQNLTPSRDDHRASTSRLRSSSPRPRSPLARGNQFTSSASCRPSHWQNFGRPIESTRSVSGGSFHRRRLPPSTLSEHKQNGTLNTTASTANTAPCSPTDPTQKTSQSWMFLSHPPPTKSLSRSVANSTTSINGSNKNVIENDVVSEVLNLNVGGTVYRLRSSTLRRSCPDSRLSHFGSQTHEHRLRLCDAYFANTNEYFFERSATLFDSIYKFYVGGQLHRPLDVCEQEFIGELQFWRISDSLIATCCQPQYEPIDESTDGLNINKKREVDETFKERLHRFIEGDNTKASAFFSFISIVFVLISVFGLVLGSIEEFQIPYERVGNQTLVVHNVSKGKKQVSTYVHREFKANTPKGVTWEPHYAFAYLETVCIAWFTLEYALRWCANPSRLVFMCGILNIVDLTAILPYYLELFLSLGGFDVDSLSDIKGAFFGCSNSQSSTCRSYPEIVTVCFVLSQKLIILFSYSTGMQTFALTLRSSARQLGMMGMVLFTGVIFFSTLLYFVEKDEPETPFNSIPTAFWWAIVTMSTVGYGDQIPKTTLGKVIASGAILSGVLVLALPITIIVDNFMRVSGSLQSRPAVKRAPGQISVDQPSIPPSPVNGSTNALSAENNEKTQLTA